MTDETLLRALQERPVLERMGAYAKMSGPGYMQSAMTLGGGSVASCVLMGSMLGYELLWVQPLAIFFGVTILAAIAKQTCHTQEKPYAAFWHRLHPSMALIWGISALVATVIWHFPQYSLSANGASALLAGLGFDLATLDAGPRSAALFGIGIVLLALSAWVVDRYETSASGLKGYELSVKYLVWAIVGAFAIVAIASGVDFGRFFLGITGISFAQRVMADGLPAATIRPIVGGLAAAVGINMVFLYPYSLLRKKWGPAHKEVAYFDLVTGMLVPFLVATTFIIVATANTIGPAAGQTGGEVRDIRELVPVLSSTFGPGLALFLVGFGMLAVGLSTIITHMLACGFIGCEVFGQTDNRRARRWFSFLPAVGIFGVVYPFPWAMSVTASTLAYPLMPVAVIGFILLLNRSDYMGTERPTGRARFLWNAVLSFAVLFMIGAAWLAIAQNWADMRALFGFS